MPPRAPILELQYTTTNSIRFRWNHPNNGGATIQGTLEILDVEKSNRENIKEH